MDSDRECRPEPQRTLEGVRRKGRIATEAPKVILNEENESARMLAGYSVKSDRGILAAMASPMRDQPETTGDLLLGIKD